MALGPGNSFITEMSENPLTTQQLADLVEFYLDTYISHLHSTNSPLPYRLHPLANGFNPEVRAEITNRYTKSWKGVDWQNSDGYYETEDVLILSN